MRVSNLLVSFLVLGGCATSGAHTETPGTSTATATTQRRSTDVISTEELATVAHYDLYAAINQLRPAYLVTRGASTLGVGTAPEVVQVYVDGVRKGDLQVLHQINAIDVKEVRHLSATEATQRFGTGNTLGAIVVTRK
jgi:hypothetical protein